MSGGRRNEFAELLFIVFIGILLKLFAGRNSLTENGIIFPGYDEYYHMRRILYTVNHFPNTLWFDSYLNYPYGMDITWPPLYDQLSAALSLALGQHSRGGIEMVSAFMPIIIGSIAVVVVYYVVRELFDGKVALLASFMTVLAPNYLIYTMFGSTDHHSLEVLLQLLSLLFIILALTRPEKRNSFAIMAGIMMAALAYTWQGADIYLGMFLIYAAVQITFDLRNGSSSKDTAKTLLAAYGVALVLIIPFWNTPWMSPSFVGLGIMIAALFLIYVYSHFLAEKKIHWMAFPLSIIVLAFVFSLITQFTSGLFGAGRLISAGFWYIWGGGMLGKILEAEPLAYDARTFSKLAFSSLGLNLLLSIGGVAAVILSIMRNSDSKRSAQILLLVWSFYMILLTFGQSRFLYISAIVMGVLISVLFFSLIDLAQKNLAKRKKKAPIGLAILLLLLLVMPTLSDTIFIAESAPPAVAGDWYQSLIWLKNNSNTTSFYENPSEEGEYSVMNWWDYGNWILYLSERPVVANNFQAGAQDAAKFYLSENEEHATSLLDTRKSKYILTDYKMIYGKLGALAAWLNKDINIDSYFKFENKDSQITAIPQEKLFNTTLARLYLLDGAGTGHFRLIHESATISSYSGMSEVKIFEHVPGAIIRVRTASDRKVGAVLNVTTNQGRDFIYINEGVPKGDALEIRVPYSTEKKDGVRSIGSYIVFSGNNNIQNTLQMNVSEKDVLEGNILEVDLE